MAFGDRGRDQIQPAVDDRLKTCQLPEEWRAMVGKGNERFNGLVADYDKEYRRLAGLMMDGEIVVFDKLNRIKKEIESAGGVEKVEQ